MNILNNNVLEVLPSLLDKTKIQSMRTSKKFNVGDIIELVWERDSKYNFFWNETGLEVLGKVMEENGARFVNTRDGSLIDIFNKNLGKVKIEVVMDITITSDESFYINNHSKGYMFQHYYMNSGAIMLFARSEGFKSVNELFKYLDRTYDMSKPIDLTVYQWSWMK